MSTVGNKPKDVVNISTVGDLTVTGNTILGDAVGDTVTVQAGTAALPSIIPSGDPNMGVWFPAADTVAVSTAGAERLRIDTSGDVGIGVTPTAGINAALQIKDGIKFPDTPVISSNRYTLDAYDEGTWTPTATNFGGTVSTVSGTYVRIGRQVSFSIYVSGTAMTTTANSSTLSLPPSLTNGAHGSGTCSTTSALGGTTFVSTTAVVFEVSLTSSGVIVASGTYFI